jgi:lysyl endopeptidase
MKKFTKTLLMLILGSSAIQGQTFNFGSPRGYTEIDNKEIVFHKMPVKDNVQLLAQELLRRKSNFEKMLYFGTTIPQNVNIVSAGNVKILSNGDKITSYGISSAGALSLNLIFREFFLSPGATLYVYNAEKTNFIGAHTSLNNNVSNVIGTDLLFADKCVIELYEPKNQIGQSRLHLDEVIHGFESIYSTEKVLGSSGDCEFDVNCPIGAGWENQRNSAVMLVAGNGVCSAALINNTLNDLTPYVLTASHCGFDAAWVYRFRWESPVGQTVCGVAGASGNGPETMNINGGTLKADYGDSDALLTLLNSTPNPGWNIFYAGWDRSGIAATSAVGIHHPAGDIKKITFENEPLISTSFGGNPPDYHWGTTDWDSGVTEGGSSGSPLFDQNKRIVGQLHGGPSFCGGANLQDQYGKLSVSWNGGGTASTRLKDWLDPNNSNVAAIDGIDPAAGSVPLEGAVQSLTGISGKVCGTVVTPSFTLYNPGSTALTSATITYGYDGSFSQTYNWIGNIAQYANAVINLPAQTLTNGNHTFGVLLTQINGVADPVTTNNSITGNVLIVANPRTYTVEIKLDCYGSETSWLARKNGVTLASGGPYTNSTTPQIVISESFCVSAADTCFQFKIIDSYSDGFIAAGGCTLTGSAKVTSDLGIIVAEVVAAEGDFATYVGDSIIKNSTCLASNIGIETIESSLFLLYPNPTNSNAVLNFGELEGAKSIAILDASGKVLMRLETNKTKIELPLAKFSKGIYFVEIATENGVNVQRIVKE